MSNIAGWVNMQRIDFPGNLAMIVKQYVTFGLVIINDIC